MIKIHGITKIYTMGDNKVYALKGVDLEIETGDFVAIMGPSGSGKSTLAQILGLLDTPSEGEYYLHGNLVSQLHEDDLAVLRRDEIGFIFQQFNLLPRLTTDENVKLPLFYSKNKHQDLADSLLKMVGIFERRYHRPNELSGGQQQRVAIARALVNRPRIIFADEPTGNLDSKSEKDIMEILHQLNEQGITIIMVTHEEEIGRQARRLIKLKDGEITSDERLLDIGEKKDVEVHLQKKNNESEILEHFKQGLKTLLANKVRTFLSILGILIGVAAVVAMLALGAGAQKTIENQMTSLGSNLLVLRPGAMRVGAVRREAGASTRLTEADAKFLQEKLEYIKGVIPTVTGRVQVSHLNQNWNSMVYGVTADYEKMRASTPTHGRFITDADNKGRARVALLGRTVVRELFGDKNPIGESIRMNRISFRVIGILPEKGDGGWRDQDDVVMVPLQTAMKRLLGKDYVDSIDIEIESADILDVAQDDILNLMLARKRIVPSQRENAFRINNMAEIQDALEKTGKTMGLLLASIAGISLLVGGIGIMNIMLVSVTERTKEIGLRKAIGAKQKDILLQFLVESVVVSVTGGILGVVLAWTITLVVALISGWEIPITTSSIILAVSFSALIGIIFGIYPARKASKFHPIVALRYD